MIDFDGTGACIKHKVISCPSREWEHGRTVLSLTPDGALVHATLYYTAASAQAAVDVNDEWWRQRIAEYAELGIERPLQFTLEGRIRHVVWNGEDKPTHDAWGRDII